jgi:hypothetical protein
MQTDAPRCLDMTKNNQPVYVYKKDLNLAGQPVGIINRILKILGIVKDVVSEDATFKRFVEAPIAEPINLKRKRLLQNSAYPKLILGGRRLVSYTRSITARQAKSLVAHTRPVAQPVAALTGMTTSTVGMLTT